AFAWVRVCSTFGQYSGFHATASDSSDKGTVVEDDHLGAILLWSRTSGSDHGGHCGTRAAQQPALQLDIYLSGSERLARQTLRLMVRKHRASGGTRLTEKPPRGTECS